MQKEFKKAKIYRSLTLNIKVNFAIVGRTESQLPVSVTVRQSRAYQQWYYSSGYNVSPNIITRYYFIINFDNAKLAATDLNTKPEDHWSCIAHLSAEEMLKSAVIEEKKFKHSPRVGADNPFGPKF